MTEGWIWEDDGLAVPIIADDYYAAAVEANGNLTLAHRRDGQLLLFAPDHAYSGVTPLAGCPPYSLLTIDDVPNLATWIEVCAAAWRYPKSGDYPDLPRSARLDRHPLSLLMTGGPAVR